VRIKRRAILLPALLFAGAFGAYRGHGDNSDVKALLSASPSLKGTAADSCATCHRSGQVADPAKPGSMRRENHCGYCHAIFVAGKGDIRTTLNPYGSAYLSAGRNPAAVNAIAGKDSDGDGFANDVEFARGTNPGDPASNPSAPVAPSRILTVAEIRKLSPVRTETIFVNTTKSRSGDSYNAYRGNSVYELLQQVGVSENADSVDFISVDGYEQTVTMQELRTSYAQGYPVMGLGKSDLGACGWVNYSVPGLNAKTKLSDADILLAFEENGTLLEKARVDRETGRVSGAGPLRLIVPQFMVSPPDLPQTADPSCSGKVAAENRFHEDYDHNGGKCEFAVIAVRVNPLPQGARDFGWESIREELLASEKVVVFGALRKSGQ
jgi:hypothetical protein